MSRYKKSNRAIWAVVIIGFLVLALVVTGVCLELFGTGKWKPSEWFKRAEIETPADEGEPNQTGGVIVPEETPGQGISLMKYSVPLKAFAAYGIPEDTQEAFTLTATVTPANATVKTLSWSVVFNDAESAWATGKDVTDYVELTAVSEDTMQATVSCKAVFGEPILVRVVSDSDNTVGAVCRCDYMAEVEDISVALYQGDEAIEELPIFGEDTEAATYQFKPTVTYGCGTIRPSVSVGSDTFGVDPSVIEAMNGSGDQSYSAETSEDLLTSDLSFTVSYIDFAKSLVTASEAEDENLAASFWRAVAGSRALKLTYSYRVSYRGEVLREEQNGGELVISFEGVSYTVTFKNGTETVYTAAVSKGTAASYDGETPEKESTATVAYTFAGWEASDGTRYAIGSALPGVTQDTVYTAYYTESARTYTVTFMNGDEVVRVQSLAYGVQPSCASQNKESSVSHNYSFNGWRDDQGTVYKVLYAGVNPLPTVTRDVTYTAEYRESVRIYEVYFKSEDGTTILEAKQLGYGANVTYTKATPTKEGAEGVTYEFAGWEATDGTRYPTGTALPTLSGVTVYKAYFTEIRAEQTDVEVSDVELDEENHIFGKGEGEE